LALETRVRALRIQGILDQRHVEIKHSARLSGLMSSATVRGCLWSWFGHDPSKKRAYIYAGRPGPICSRLQCISALGLEMQLSSSRKDSKKKGSSKKKSASVSTQEDGDDDWNSTLEVGDVKDSNGALLSEGDSVVVTQVPNASLTDYRTLASNI